MIYSLHSHIICFIEGLTFVNFLPRQPKLIKKKKKKKYESDKNRLLHYFSRSYLRIQVTKIDQERGNFCGGGEGEHSDIFFPPTWDSSILNHPEFSSARYFSVPRKGRGMKKNEKRVCGQEKRRRRGERKRPGSSDVARDAALRDCRLTREYGRIGT